jgi:polyferredoxin
MDLLRLPLLGRFLRWRHARLTLQTALLALAAAVVVHGLTGPPIAPRNLATVLTAIHWRGLLVVAVLALGNLFCTSCPMMLVRDAGRRLYHPALRWPRQLRGKWLAIALLGLVLFVYELFDVWSLPRATAWFVLGYFAVAFVVDVVFAGAAFCKYLCPIGQFNFIASSMSPTELQVRDLSTCRTCRTADCIKGRVSETVPRRIERRGCELGLFLPVKVGNLDCTMCLDCVQACPHDNIALATRVPGGEWLDTGRRSGIGRLQQRHDIAALAVVFTFAAFLNAFAMTAPATVVEHRLAAMMGAQSEAPALLLLFVVGLVAVPVVLVGGAGLSMRSMLTGATSVRTSMTRYAFSLVPIGVGVWLAHYGFHLLTGIATVLPVTQSAAVDLSGYALFGEPAWGWVGLQPGSVFPLQLGVVLLGAAGSAGLVHATSLRDHPTMPGRASAPWLALVALLTTAALWILSQPMEMRAVSVLG